jgi:transposase InsO family protein
MNYQTEIAFALRVLRDAEAIDFDEEKVDEMIRQNADYMRVFLPKPHLLTQIYIIAARTFVFFEKEFDIKHHLEKLKKRQQTLKDSILNLGKVWWWQRKKQATKQTLQEALEETRYQITNIMTDFQSPSGLGSEIQTTGLTSMFAEVLSPPDMPNTPNHLEDILYREIYVFYEKKLPYLNNSTHI